MMHAFLLFATTAQSAASRGYDNLCEIDEENSERENPAAASIRSLAGWEVRVHDSEAGSAQQPDGGGEANAGEEAGASWATQVSDWSTFPKPPDSKRG